MSIGLLFAMVVAALVGTVVYTAIGIAPGTDETAVLAPVTLALVLAGLPLPVVLAFFMAAIVAKKLTDSIPVAVAGIPGGVMAAPMVEPALELKALGLASTSIRKMASGSVIGTLIAVPASLALASVLTPLADTLAQYANYLFLGGAIFLALMARERWIALLSIVPLAILIQALRQLYWGTGVVPQETTVFISFFLGITIGPMIFNLFELVVSQEREQMRRSEGKLIRLLRGEPVTGMANPFKELTRAESASAALGAVLGTVFFFMSPVGLTVFLGETLASRVKDAAARASRKISTMDALTNAAYISGIIVPLAAIGIPLSPMAIGPANPFFNAPPRLTLEQNAYHLMSFSSIAIATAIGAAVAVALTYTVAVRYAQPISTFVFRYIPHEAFIGTFLALVLMLAFLDAGIMGIFGVAVLALVAGLLHRWGVNYGVMFMTLYAAPFLVGLLAG